MSQQYEYLKTDVVCPFFQNIKNGTDIVCESPYEGCTNLTIRHQNKKEMNKQRILFCCNKYKNCEIYRMIIEAKY